MPNLPEEWGVDVGLEEILNPRPAGPRINPRPEPVLVPPQPVPQLNRAPILAAQVLRDHFARWERAVAREEEVDLDGLPPPAPENTGREKRMDETKYYKRYPVLAFDKPLGKLFGKKGYQKTKQEGVVGIEVEQETKMPFELPDLDYWAVHREGSLRDFGFEYVLSPPQQIASAEKSVKQLFQKLPVAKLSNSIRTSIHVHFDVTEYTLADLTTFACLYWICEPLLIGFAGDTRKGNLFCLQAANSNYLQKLLANSLRNADVFDKSIWSDNTRYASLNFASVQKFGSIETRLMRGTSDYKEVLFWVKVVEAMRQFALKYDNPNQFLKKIFQKDYTFFDLYREVFDKDDLKTLLKCSSSEKEVTQEAQSVASSLFCILVAREKYDVSAEQKLAFSAAEEEEKNAVRQAQEAQRLNTRLFRQYVVNPYPQDDDVGNFEPNPDQIYIGLEGVDQ